MKSPTRPSGQSESPHGSKVRLLNAGIHVIRAKGYAATTVEDICREAGVTKGSFFHHFKSKDDLALATVAQWRAMTEGFFAAAPYHHPQDPLDRLLGYLDFRAAILTGELPDYTCLLGTLVQETYDTHPTIRAACDEALTAHIAEFTRDVQAAKQRYAPDASWKAEGVGGFIQAVLQGSFIFAKANQGPEVIRENLEHLRRYLQMLFSTASSDRNRNEASTHPTSSAQENNLSRDQSHFVD